MVFAAAFAMGTVPHGVGASLIEAYSSEFAARAMLGVASPLGIAAAGHTLVVLLGGIDLSVPFLIGFGRSRPEQKSDAAVALIMGIGRSLTAAEAESAYNSPATRHPIAL